jgi:hypothetical protein
VLRWIKHCLKRRRFRKALKCNIEEISTLADSYYWLRTYIALKSDTTLSSRIRFIIPEDGFITTHYDNIATLMDAANDACLFYKEGKRLVIEPSFPSKTISYHLFLMNRYNEKVPTETAIDYISTYLNYFVDDLMECSHDEHSTIVVKTHQLIIDVVRLMQASLSF